MLKVTTLTLAALAAAISSPALAQSETAEDGFTGFYVGGSVGVGFSQNDGNGSSILFDRDLNGTFGDTVTTNTGANAFSPGFCGGAALGNTAGQGCRREDKAIEYMGRVGFDIQRGSVVFGIVGEAGVSEIRDGVAAFSSTPAQYTMIRDLKFNGGLRARVGYTPNNSTLFYATGGGAYGKVRNSFNTSNTANSFTLNGDSDAWGFGAGGGVEQKIGKNFSVGVEYLYTDLYNDKARVRVGPGTAPATNPFLLANAGGTDFKRSDPHFRWHAIRAVATFRF
jgi:outer membrane immunogenic protein